MFGRDFAGGEVVLVVLAATMLVATAVGPVDVVLLMGGRSSWNLVNTVVALGANLALNVALIPRYGLAGAAVASAVGILLNNLLPLAQVWRSMGLHPFGPGAGVAGGPVGGQLRGGRGGPAGPGSGRPSPGSRPTPWSAAGCTRPCCGASGTGWNGRRCAASCAAGPRARRGEA